MKRYLMYQAVCAVFFMFSYSLQAAADVNNTLQIGAEEQQQGADIDEPTLSEQEGVASEKGQNQVNDGNRPPVISENPLPEIVGEQPQVSAAAADGETPVAEITAEGSALERNGWLVEDQEISPDDAPIAAVFGNSMAVSGSTWVIGADGGADHSGAVYIYIRNESGEWVREGKLALESPANRDEYFYYGRSVAISGDTLAVVVPGNIYVYSRTNEGWAQQAKIAHSAKAYNFFLAPSVAISGDTLLVGGSVPDSSRASEGIVSVFKRDTLGNWTKVEDLGAPPAPRANHFGHSVAIDGDIAVVGDSLFSSADDFLKGIFWLYRRNSLGNWERVQGRGVGGDDPQPGVSVAISGNRIVVGGQKNAAVVVELNDDGSTSRLELSVADGDPTFGSSVAINGDLIVVGANGKVGGRVNAGAAYVFKRSLNGDWKQLATLRSHTGGGLFQRPLGERGSITGRKFGSSAAIADGGNVLVGATGGKIVWLAKPTHPGFAYSFHLVCQASMELPRNQWRMISLPCQPPVEASTVGGLFADLGLGEYDKDWAVYRYDPASSYVKLSLNSDMSQGRGYWMIQNGKEGVHLSMPAGSLPTSVDVASYLNHDYDVSKRCDSKRGCFSIPLVNSGSNAQWNLRGHPFRTATPLDKIRLVTDSATSPNDCSGIDGCSLSQGETDNIVKSVFWIYKEGQYQTLGSGSVLSPWDGFFSAPLAGANGGNAKLLISKE